MDLELTKQVVVVTGSTRGIGFAIAAAFAKEGATVICTGTQQEKCDQAAQSLCKKYGIDSTGISVDVSNVDSCSQLIKQVIDTYGKIDVLVNNAGITRDNLLLRMKFDEWNDVINTNLSSLYYCVKPCIRHMLKQRSGCIINMSSIIGVIGNAGQSNYAAAKSGMIGFTMSVAKEFGAKGIRCNAVAPGFIQTDMTNSLPNEFLDTIIKKVSVNRLGQADEVSNLVLFLASKKSSYITGQTIVIDGGLN
tara:strand:- start:109 stop:855 length:747 start_codon:yes stop_codon:yes gene_type:complete